MGQQKDDRGSGGAVCVAVPDALPVGAGLTHERLMRLFAVLERMAARREAAVTPARLRLVGEKEKETE